MPKKNKPAQPKDKSPYAFQRDKIAYDLDIRELPWTEKQQEFLARIQDKETKLVFLLGPAGSSKSLLAIYCGLQALRARKHSHIIYSRPILESSDSGSRLGFLPGERALKEKPYTQVITEKLEELLPKEQMDKLNKEERIEFTEVNYIRGRSMNAVFLILDEQQSSTEAEIITMVSRIGKYSKVIICADPEQSDLPPFKRGGVTKLAKIFDDEESRAQGIHILRFTEEDIVRSGFCKFFIQKVNQNKKAEETWSPSSS